MQETLRTVKYSVSDDVKFEKIALKLGRSKRQVFSQMVDYFYRSKKDPIDLNDELLKNTILKGQKEYIGFIKTQETELLIPIKMDAGRLIEAMKKISDAFDEKVAQQNKKVLENQTVQVEQLTLLNTTVKSINTKVKTRDMLKGDFLSILNGYIRDRERFTIMTSAKEKEELAERARFQINLL